MKMTREALLIETATLLFGTRWKVALAEAVGVTNRTIYLWEKSAPPAGHPLWGRLTKLVDERTTVLADVRCRVQGAAS